MGANTIHWGASSHIPRLEKLGTKNLGTVRIFKHHVHLGFVWLAVAEFLLFMFSVYLGSLLRFQGDVLQVEESIGPVFPRALSFALLLLMSMAAVGLYQPRLREGHIGILLRTISAFMVMGVGLSLLFYLFPDLLLGRGALVLAILAAFVFSILCRAALGQVVGEERLKRKVLVYGAGHRAEKMMGRLRRKSDRRGFTVFGFVAVGGEGIEVDPKQVFHMEGSIRQFALDNEIDEIVVAMDDRRKALPIDDLLQCKLAGVEVLDIVTFFEKEAGKIILEFLSPSWMVFSAGFDSGSVRSLSKRAFDLITSYILLMFAWPIMLLVVFAIWIEDGFKAPIVYRQKRVGKNGEVFEVLKFRSMTTDAEKDGKAVWAKANDSRVTKVGGFIRRYRIDELPQIINVLAGDMSFVGPRPERPEFVDRLQQSIPHFTARHQVKPGIAGWAQLNYPYGANDKDAEQKLQYDLYYVKNHSLFLDFLILLQTFEVVLFGKGVR